VPPDAFFLLGITCLSGKSLQLCMHYFGDPSVLNVPSLRLDVAKSFLL